MVRAEILGARAIPRDAHLEKVNNLEQQNKIIFNITHQSVLRDVRKILEELHLILTSGQTCGEQKYYQYNNKVYVYKRTQQKCMKKDPVPKQALKQKSLLEHYCSD